MSYSIDDFKEFQANILKPTDTFQFSCKMCGDCCRKRQEPIMLTGLDLFRIAQALNMEPRQVVEEKTIGYLGDSSHVPILTLKERLDGSCSLLRKGKCMVQSSKPVVCALFPLGRMYNAITHEIQYFKNTHSCQTGSAQGKVWTLQEWLDEFNLTELNEASMVWNRLLMGITKVTCSIDKDKISDKMMAVMGNCMYINYDISKPYIQQAEKNMMLMKLAFRKLFNTEIIYE